jgi:hypothetical protein
MFKFIEPKIFKVLIIILLALAVGLLSVILLFQFNVLKAFPQHSVIYLQTGEIYFGKLSQFPYPVLENGYILQRSQDGSISLLPISSTIWEPAGYIRLNKDAIVFTAPLAKTSAVYRMIISQQQGEAIKVSPSLLAPNSSLLPPDSSIEPAPILSPAD